MASYKVVLKPSVEKDLRSVPKTTIQRILTQIDTLAEDPFPSQSAKLSGARNLYRLRVGDYRIVYGVHGEEKIIIVQYIRHRREAYQRI
jgi:mRNA interferase RelE/StbE